MIKNKQLSWNAEESNPLEDIKRIKKIIERDTGLYKNINFREYLYYEAQTLYLLGCAPEQVNNYIKSVFEVYYKHEKE